MRRRPVERVRAVPPSDAVVPAVERWCTAGEIKAHTFTTGCPACGPTMDCGFSLRYLAWRRQRAFRLAWLTERAVPPQDQGRVWPLRGPVMHP